MRVLVMGGNGFLGSHLVDSLAAQGHEVTAFDLFGSAGPQWTAPNVTALEGNLFDRASVAAALDGQDWAVHSIAATVPATSEGDPSVELRTVVPSTIDAFADCADRGVGVAFISSGGTVYGEQGQESYSESNPTRPLTPYGIAKTVIEDYLRYFNHVAQMPYVSFRVANPYGPRQNPNKRQGVIPVMLNRILSGKGITMVGDGSAVRDYIYVEDAASMMATALTRGATQSVYNIGSGRGHSLSEIVDAVRAVTASDPQVSCTPAPLSYVDKVVLDISRYCDEFGAPSFVELATGVARTWDHLRSLVQPPAQVLVASADDPSLVGA